jgi:hypothetical protein
MDENMRNSIAATIDEIKGDSFPEFQWSKDVEVCVRITNLRESNSGSSLFYLIGAVDPDHPQDPEFNDCTARLPGDTGWTGSQKLVYVLPGPASNSSNVHTRTDIFDVSIVYEADFGDGFVALTDADRIDSAEDVGLVELFPLGFRTQLTVLPDSECGED